MDAPSALLELQECDLEIHRAEKQLDELPEKRTILETRRKSVEVGELKTRAELLVNRLERTIAANNDEVSSIDEKIASVQATLDSGKVTNPKEVHNFSREIDALRRRKDKLDTDTLGVMERMEKAGLQLNKIDAALQKLTDDEVSLIERFREKGGQVQTTLEESKARRTSIVAELDDELLQRYERIREAKGGIGAARLRQSACTACRVELPIERLRDLREGPDIAVCPSCRRLLVVRGVDVPD